MDFHDRRDDSHFDIALEASRHLAAKDAGVDVGAVRTLKVIRNQPLHKGADLKHTAMFGYTTPGGQRTGRTVNFNEAGESAHVVHRWPEYSRADSPFNDKDWGD